MSGSTSFALGGLALIGALLALSYGLGIIGVHDRDVRRRVKNRTTSASAAVAAKPVVHIEERATGIGRYITPPGSLVKLERNIMLAGRPEGWTVAKFVTYKVVGVGIGGLLLLSLVSSKPTLVNFLTGFGAILFGYLAPDAIVANRAEARQKVIQRELPDVLDQVTIAIESGLGFEAAFSHIGDRRTGPLAEEVVRAVQDMRLGMSRKDAYQAMADRTDVPDLNQFVRSIVQAEQYGVSIAKVVRTQAEEIRFSRKKRAEAEALKVPVKIVFPLLVCILPVLFAVILTPAIMSLAESLA
ncbi:type II secretion system F family protein [Aeromicrobium terrae]|uniref:Type II secretion system F family protein n=1 Tax=Aeromicrobium terrae TaxID=2498846 RepID=A0A5C8NLK3_9ACTN|nr:type II secretion system F family protein [Aeromicrobium terrae]TXL62128.1 type II secretion system F family protein [Aeromicrobium terrae]